jgi:hypothetical protein
MMLKRILLAIAIALITTQARSAITIAIQTEPVAVGELVQLTVEGVDPAMLPETKAFCWPEEGTTFIPAKLWDSRPVIFFQAKQPGVYLVYVNSPIAGEDKTEDVKVIITVIGEGPAPDPFPEPRPEPIPVNELSVVIIYEATNRPPAETLTLIALAEHAQTRDYLLFRMEDKDLIGRTQQPPEWFRPYLAAAKSVPAIVIGRTKDGAFSIVAVEPLPATGAEAVAVLKRWGG